MRNGLKISLVSIIIIAVTVLAYRVFAVRVVNYEIGGIQIPSRYNILTGKVVPIAGYSGKGITATVKSHKLDDLGLSEEQVALAQFKWAIFEQWANARQEYKEWEDNPEIFKKANDEFRRQMKSAGIVTTK